MPGQEWGQEAQLTDGAVGARIARAGTVTLVAVKAEADTDPLVLAWVVTTGVHCRGEAEIRDHLEQPPPPQPHAAADGEAWGQTWAMVSSHSSVLTHPGVLSGLQCSP